MKIDTVLIPLDGSTLAEQAITHTLELTSGREPTLVLLRAAVASSWPGTDPTDEQVRVVREAEDYLAAVKADLAARGVRRVETSVWYGMPDSAIVDAAKVNQVDLIVMTTHGRSGLGRLVMGSVAEAVLRGTTTPILMLRAPQAPLQTPAGRAETRGTAELRR